MSFKENVARHKSARWAKAAANYDGDDWSDDGWDNEEDQEEYDDQLHSHDINLISNKDKVEHDEQDDADSFDATQPTPTITVEEQFSKMDLDDEYSKLVQDNEDDDEDFKPQTQPRFEPIKQDIEELPEETVVTPVVEVPQQLPQPPVQLPVQQLPSQLPPPNQQPQTYQFHEEPFNDYNEEQEQEQEEEEQEEGEEQEEDDDDDSIGDSEVNAFPEVPIVSDPILSIPIPSNEYVDAVPLSEDESDEEYKIHKVNTGFDNYKDDSDEEDYKPKSSHFISNLPTDTLNEVNDYKKPYEESYKEEEPYENKLNDSIQYPESNIKNLSINAPAFNNSLQPPIESPAIYELSDTDTLHVHEPEINDSDSNDEINVNNHENQHQLPRDISTKSINHDEFKEHAYLGELINTPDPNEIQEFIPQELTEDLQSSPKLSNEVRDSKFYSSASDYFDDYQDDDEEELEENNHEDYHEDHHQHHESEDEHEFLPEATKTLSNASSGSLSTGGVSIKSETGYRFSKISDRSASFTNKSLNQSDNQSFGDSISEEKDKDISLNPAMSINFGQWRPNTESFRDQFISGSSTIAPPIPKLDNYTRNSNGEIIEDVNSIAGSIGIDSNNARESTLADSSLEIKSLNNEETYRTDSNSLLPTHIPLDSPIKSDSKENPHFFQERNLTSTTIEKTINNNNNTIPIDKIKKPMNKYHNMKKISTLDKSTNRIDKYQTARIEEANIETEINDWIQHALEKVEVVSYSTNVSTNHVKQAYAEAANVPNPGRRHNNLGSILNKSRVFHETSNTAQSFAKGIFSRGKKIIKN